LRALRAPGVEGSKDSYPWRVLISGIGVWRCRVEKATGWYLLVPNNGKLERLNWDRWTDGLGKMDLLSPPIDKHIHSKYLKY
jgi:hypothetical protein